MTSPTNSSYRTGQKTDWRFPLEQEKKSQSLAVIRHEAARKRIRHYPAFMEHVWNQLRFQSPAHWLIHGGLLLTAMLLALFLRRESAGNMASLATCSVFFVFSGNICLSSIASLFSRHMAELEQTLYLNLKQMICIRMLEAGIIDLGILALFTAAASGKNTAGTGAALIYMLAPFLWSDILYLHMLVYLRNISSGFRSFALGLLCGIAALFPALWKPAYLPEYLVVWQIMTIAGMFLLIASFANLLKKIDLGDHICFN